MALSQEQFYTLCLFQDKILAVDPKKDVLTSKLLRELRKMRMVVLLDQTSYADIWLITRIGKAARGMGQSTFGHPPIKE